MSLANPDARNPTLNPRVWKIEAWILFRTGLRAPTLCGPIIPRSRESDMAFADARFRLEVQEVMALAGEIGSIPSLGARPYPLLKLT